MSIEILSLQRALPVDIDRLHRHAELALEVLGHDHCDLSLVLVNDRRMRELNRTYRGKPSTTDVLSFEGPSNPLPRMPRFLGEIVISVPRAHRQAMTAGLSPEDELTNLLIHGVCHLLGFDHERGEEDQRIMKAEEEKVARHIRRKDGRGSEKITGKIQNRTGDPDRSDRKRIRPRGRGKL
ncbi:MAG: rRNA maturation RNase YbeY [Leptospirillia bacterium]